MSKTVLLVDDQADNLLSLKMLLKLTFKGMRILTSETVEEATTILSKTHVDLILSDVDLGTGFGPDIHKAFPHTPIIYLTGDSHWRAPDHMPVVHKPYELDDLKKKMQKYIGESMYTLTKLIANNEVTIEDAVNNLLLEVAPPGWSGTTKALKKHSDRVDNPWALAWWMHKRGAKPHYPTEEGKPKYKKPSKIIKMVKINKKDKRKEESEVLDEQI